MVYGPFCPTLFQLLFQLQFRVVEVLLGPQIEYFAAKQRPACLPRLPSHIIPSTSTPGEVKERCDMLAGEKCGRNTCIAIV